MRAIDCLRTGCALFLLFLPQGAVSQDFVRASEIASNLERGTKEVRKQALEQLRLMGPDAVSEVEAIKKALSDTSAEVRLTAVQALSAIGVGARSASPSLRPLLSDTSESVRASAASLLEQFEGPQERREQSKKVSRREIERATKASLHEIGVTITPKDAAELLIQGLRSSDPKIQRETADALTALSGESLKKLEGLLQSRDPSVRASATRALGAHGAAALPVFVRGLENLSADVRARSAQGIRLVSPPLGEAALLSLRRLLQDPDPTVRVQAALTLGGAAPNDLAPVPVLLDALSLPDQSTRSSAVLALARFGDAAVPLVLEALQRKNPEARLGALSALSFLRLPPETLQDQVEPLLKDKDSRVREKARVVLAQKS